MCGISGLVHLDPERPICADELARMCKTLIHRGPDDEGRFVQRNVGLCVRRLNVIDLVTGHQPISNEDGRIWIVFNGEIYNYPELRKQLENRGHKFSTNTDTETIVHLYEERGEDCVTDLNGMFAFAIWDGHKQKLLLARDRLGVKPLYYCLTDHSLVFGSELKAILECREVPRELDYQALDSFLTLEYIPAPLSIFRGIQKLPPGHTLTLQDGRVSVLRYWDLSSSSVTGEEESLSEALYDLLADAVRIRLVSDVPLGAFLSGGIDSSTIVYLMNDLMDRPVSTFSIGFDDPSYNELAFARTVARRLATDHHELIIQPTVVRWVEELIGFLDEPLADFSIFPTYLVSKLARERVTVALSGDGGDELFAGYEWYIAAKLDRLYRRFPSGVRKRWIPWIVNGISPSSQKKGFVNKVKRFVEGSAFPEWLQHFRWNLFLTEEEKGRLYSPELRKLVGDANPYGRVGSYLGQSGTDEPLWQQQYADIKTYLVDDILVKVDRMSMANSLEVRTPYLDYRVVEFAAGLPSDLKLRGLKTKHILKRAMKGKLPDEVLHRRKEGFSIPMKTWLRQELRPLLDEYLAPARVGREGLFSAEYVERLKGEHLRGVANHSHQLWALMMFAIWRDSYLR